MLYGIQHDDLWVVAGDHGVAVLGQSTDRVLKMPIGYAIQAARHYRQHAGGTWLITPMIDVN